MKRDTVKTMAGLIIIVGIVVATFMYGNAQRQKQLAHDQQVKQQQETTAQQQAKSVSPSTAATSTATASNAPASNKGATVAPKVTTAPKVTANSSTPVTGGTGAQAPAATADGGAALPDTGPESIGMVGVGLIAVMLLAVRRSRRDLLAAARSAR